MWCSTSDPERARRELVRAWLTKAEEDLRAAEAILAAPMPSYGTASFHAQQGAEKALKALLAPVITAVRALSVSGLLADHR